MKQLIGKLLYFLAIFFCWILLLMIGGYLLWLIT